MIAVVKVGGGGTLIDEGSGSSLPWLAYRRLQIDVAFIKRIAQGVAGAAPHKVVLVAGGMAAYLYIEAGRKLGLPEEALAKLGRHVVNTNGHLFLQVLRSAGVRVHEHLVSPHSDIYSLLQGNDVVVLAAEEGILSTDELAARAAAGLEGSELLLFKRGVPIYHLGFDTPTERRTFSLRELQTIATSVGEKAGHNSILDGPSMGLIEAHSIPTRLIDADQVDLLSLILSTPCDPCIRQTTIER